jgi:hypothetical protein
MSATAPASITAERMDMDGSPEDRIRDRRRRIKAKLSNFFVPVNAEKSHIAVNFEARKARESLAFLAGGG